MSSPLALVIPTLRRPRILRDNLMQMLPELQRYRIPVYVLEDSPAGEAASLVSEFASVHPLTRYARNVPSLGHDENLQKAMVMPSEPYVWLLGDSLRVVPGAIGRILKDLAVQDFLFVGLSDAPAVEAARELAGRGLEQRLPHLLWALTLTGATIYGPRVRAWMKNSGEYVCYRNFPQLSAILGFISRHPARALAYAEPLIRHHHAKSTSYWTERTLDVFVNDWCTLVESHADFIEKHANMSDVLLSHCRKTGILGFHNLMDLRARGAMNRRGVLRHSRGLSRTSTVPLSIIHSIALVPRPAAAGLLWLNRHPLVREMKRRIRN